MEHFHGRGLDDSIEFYDERDGPPATPSIHERHVTPQKATVDDCSVAIVLLKRFGPGQLPGSSGESPRPATDVTDYIEVENSLVRVFDSCCANDDLPGWLPFGKVTCSLKHDPFLISFCHQ